MKVELLDSVKECDAVDFDLTDDAFEELQNHIGEVAIVTDITFESYAYFDIKFSDESRGNAISMYHIKILDCGCD